jgi:ABC-type transporter MlaC component
MKTTQALFGSVTMAAVLFGNTVVQATSTATETVKETVVTVMGIINDPTYQQPGMSDERRAALETVLRNFVNYREMARRSLGVTWMFLTESEQERFSDLFLHVQSRHASRLRIKKGEDALAKSHQISKSRKRCSG